ncbi:MAG TPA: acetate uptake transporter [Acidobacteriaceae bacterium]
MPEPVVAITKPANPAPLGLAGFGLTTCLLCAISAGLLPHEALPAVVPLAFAYGGVAQLVAGAMEFRNGNTFGTIAFTSYGMFWWWFALLQWSVGAGWLKAPSPSGGGAVLLSFGVLTLLLWIVTFRMSKAIWSIFLLLWIAFFLLAAGDFGYATGKIGGYIGVLTGIDALLVAFIETLNATANRVVIPLGGPIVSN